MFYINKFSYIPWIIKSPPFPARFYRVFWILMLLFKMQLVVLGSLLFGTRYNRAPAEEGRGLSQLIGCTIPRGDAGAAAVSSSFRNVFSGRFLFLWARCSKSWVPFVAGSSGSRAAKCCLEQGSLNSKVYLVHDSARRRRSRGGLIIVSQCISRTYSFFMGRVLKVMSSLRRRLLGKSCNQICYVQGSRATKFGWCRASRF